MNPPVALRLGFGTPPTALPQTDVLARDAFSVRNRHDILLCSPGHNELMIGKGTVRVEIQRPGTRTSSGRTGVMFHPRRDQTRSPSSVETIARRTRLERMASSRRGGTSCLGLRMQPIRQMLHVLLSSWYPQPPRPCCWTRTRALATTPARERKLISRRRSRRRRDPSSADRSRRRESHP